ncbi:glycosyltransferase domain-containing protein [Wenyingzhuangia sp. IMCC45533]
MKIVVYTAAFGENYGFVPQKEELGVDYVCFTDDLSKVPKPWKGVKPNNLDMKSDSLRNRHIKILPHLYLEDYDFSVYIDSNYLIIGSMISAVKEMKGYKMGVFDHNQASDKRDCIYEEYKAILALGKKKNKFKDDPEIMKKQINFICKEGFPKNYGLIFAGVLLREHHDNNVVALMNQWWYMVSTMSKRDQLSFDYVRWKNNFKRYVFKGDLRKGNQYFYNLGTNRKNYWRKIIEFKLKKTLNIIK